MYHTLIFVPSYFDYVRIRNWCTSSDLDFAEICEYTKVESRASRRSGDYHCKVENDPQRSISFRIRKWLWPVTCSFTARSTFCFIPNARISTDATRWRESAIWSFTNCLKIQPFSQSYATLCNPPSRTGKGSAAVGRRATWAAQSFTASTTFTGWLRSSPPTVPWPCCKTGTRTSSCLLKSMAKPSKFIQVPSLSLSPKRLRARD